jgi:hypothetical protein
MSFGDCIDRHSNLIRQQRKQRTHTFTQIDSHCEANAFASVLLSENKSALRSPQTELYDRESEGVRPAPTCSPEPGSSYHQ